MDMIECLSLESAVSKLESVSLLLAWLLWPYALKVKKGAVKKLP